MRATTREAAAAAGAASVKDCIMHCCCTQGAASPAAYSSVCGLKLLLYKVLSSQRMRPRLLSAPELPCPHTRLRDIHTELTAHTSPEDIGKGCKYIPV